MPAPAFTMLASVEVPVWLLVLLPALAVVIGLGAAYVWRQTAAASRRYALLAELATVGGDHPPSETAQRLCDLMVPEFADMAALDVAVGDEVTRLAARVHGPNAEAVEAALLRRRHVADSWGTGGHHAFRTGEATLLQPVPPGLFRDLAGTPEDEAVFRDSGIRNAIFLPLELGDRTVGAMSFVRVSNRRFTREQVRFAELFAGRAALALDRAALNVRVERTQDRLERMVGQLEEAVLLFDSAGNVVYANDATAGLLRVPTPAALIGAEIDKVMAKFELHDEEGRAVEQSELPRVRVLAGEGSPPPLLLALVNRNTRERRWVITRASELVEPDERYVLVVSEDVTEVKESERFERTLARAGELASLGLEDREMLERVAELVVPELADWCRIDLLDPRGNPAPVVIAHTDPEKVALGWELARRFPTDPEVSGVWRVLRTGEPEQAHEIPEEALEAVAHGPEHLRLLRSIGLGASMLVPMSSGGRAVGVLTLARVRPRLTFAQRDATLAAELGRRLGAAVETARLHRERRRIADTLQAALMPPEPPRMDGWDVEAFYRAAGDANHVGGDFHDLIRHDGSMLAVVGDVAGKGAAAAALTAKARHVLATAMRITGDPQASLQHLNHVLYHAASTELVTAACASCAPAAPGEMSVMAAGHPPPILLRADGRAEFVEAGGPMLGSVDPWEWPAKVVQLEPGDTLLLYTDGVIDSVGANGRFGEERLVDAVGAGPAGSAADVLARVVDAVASFEQGPQRDDVALLALRRL